MSAPAYRAKSSPSKGTKFDLFALEIFRKAIEDGLPPEHARLTGKAQLDFARALTRGMLAENPALVQDLPIRAVSSSEIIIQITDEALDKAIRAVFPMVESSGRSRFIWDSEIDGFGVKVTPSGQCLYVFNYVIVGANKPQRCVLQWVGRWTVARARECATNMAAAVDAGRDPKYPTHDELRLVANHAAKLFGLS